MLGLRRLQNHLFLVGLALAVVLGFAGSDWLSAPADWDWLKSAVAFTVMGMMAAPVQLSSFGKALRKPWPAILATLVCFVAVPGLGYLAAAWLNQELAGGLIVACCVPSTLASAAVLTRKAGGDDTICMVVTLLTNLACAFVTPLLLVALLGQSVQLSLNQMIVELLTVVVLPIVLVQIARWRWSPFRQWSEAHKAKLTVACQVGILIMVLLGAAQMGGRWSSQPVDDRPGGGQIFAVVLFSAAIHLIALRLGWMAAGATAVGRAKQIAVGFSGSQKTLMIGLNLALGLQVSILPMIAYHVIQLLLDAAIASHLGGNHKTEPTAN
jgi:sodium/bile acid cotransporter 7